MGYLTDASYKQAQAEVYGQLTTSAVATGSQLVAFSGFSNSNYVREAYSADLDFGTGEWTASAWVNVPVTLPIATPTTGNELLNPDGWIDSNLDGFPDGWTNGGMVSSIAGGVLTLTPPGSSYTNISKIISVTQGKTYRLKLDKASGGYFYVQITNQIGHDSIGGIMDGGSLNSGTVESQFVALSNSITVTITGIVAGGWGAFSINSLSIKESSPFFISSRSFSSGSKIDIGIISSPVSYVTTNRVGYIIATAYDGTTTRTVTTTAAYNTASWTKAEACYTIDGTLSIRVNGQQVAATYGAPLLARYNLANYSQGSGMNTAWGVDTGGASTRTDNAIADPYGLVSGMRFVATSTGYPNMSQNITFSTAGTYCISFWAKVPSGTLTTSGFTFTTDWQRFSTTVTKTVGTSTVYLFNLGASATIGTEIHVWGVQVELGSTPTTYQRTSTVPEYYAAPLTIGNSYNLDAPFPGSLALLKLSATVPTLEQSQWMYEQEKQMFREGAQVALPDANAIQDLAYDDLTDRWIAVSTTNKSTWSGLVRTASEAVSAGSYTKVSAASGIQLAARSTTNPGVDITIPAYNVKARAKKKAEKSKRLTNATAIYDFTPVVFSNATLTNGSNVMTVTTANTSGTPYIGMGITGTGITSGTTIVGIVSGTPNSYYLSAAYTGTTGSTYTVGQSTFSLPVGYTARLVYSGGLIQREGSTKAFTRAFDGFRETIVFGTSPGTSVVQIHAAKQ